jgi:poly(3-hydroxybutyrate) depolymerase
LAGLLVPSTLPADEATDRLLAGDWLVLGPLPNLVADGICQGYERDLLAGNAGVASEATVKPFEGMACAGRRWTRFTLPDGRLDFAAVLGATESSVAYAWHAFETARPTRLALKVGSDDGIKIWLNGRPVLADHSHRALEEYSETIMVETATGTNHLVVKVDQGYGDWKFSLRLRLPAEEAADARRTPPASLLINLDRSFVPVRGTIRGLVTTAPSWALDDPVLLQLETPGGRLLASQETRPGRSFTLSLDPAWAGALRLRAVPGGSLACLTPAARDLYAGDAAAARSQALVLARSRSLAPAPADWRSPASVLGATWEFLGNQAEGLVDPALSGAERADRAVLEALSLAASGDAAAALRRGGLHQWAYRSPLDGTVQPYSLYLPAGFDPARRYRLAVWLHGYSGNDWDSARQLSASAPADFIILAPFGRGSIGYQGPGEQDVLDAIDLACALYPVDTDRIYLAGSSMGGMGTWRIGQFHAGRFAAIAPFCGWAPTEWLPNLLGLPTLIVHGDADQVVPIQPDQTAAAWLASAGAPVRFDAMTGAGHDAWRVWTRGATPEKLLSWFRASVRDQWPDHFTVKTSHPRYGQRHWADLAGLLQPGKPASLSVERSDERHLTVRTDNVASFDLRIDHPRLARSGRIVITVDSQSRTVDAGSGTVRFDRAAAGGPWTASRPTTGGPALVRHDGGGAADLFYRPLYIVYGTSGGIDWKACAQVLARGQAARVVADTALTQAMLAGSSLFLLGSPDENSVTARLAKALPVGLDKGKASAAGHSWSGAGVLQCSPNPLAPTNLVAVFSCPAGQRAALTFSAGLLRLLNPYGQGGDDTASAVLPDVLVFDAELKPVWAASFDRDWRNLRE